MPSSKHSSSLNQSGSGSNLNFSVNSQEPLAQRRLTRLRKLRHLTDHDVGIDFHDRPHSSPSSPDLSRKSRSRVGGSDHWWSSSAISHPLPLPELALTRRSESAPSCSGQGCVGFPNEAAERIRKSSDHVSINSAKVLGNFHKNGFQDVKVEGVNPNLGQNVQSVSASPGGSSRSSFSPNGLNRESLFHSYAGTSSAKSSYEKSRGLSQELSYNRVKHKLTLKQFPKSTPTSLYSSPVVSPRRSNGGDHFTSSVASQDFQDGLSGSGCSAKSSPSRTSNNPDHSPLHSPRALNLNIRSPNGIAFTPCMDRLESNGHVNAHPLPLPPGASVLLPSPTQVQSPNHAMEHPHVSSMKGQWQKGKLIGRGTFGSVYLGTNRETGALCAMKEVDLIPDDPKSAECIKQLEQEIKVLRQLKHRNIVQYFGSEIIDDHFYIYLEYVYPGSINKYVREHCGAITESVVRNFTRHILSGLAYLHNTKTIHRDIKGANLLVDASGVVKLADFGMAKHLTAQYDLSMKGRPHWMAPELIKATLQKGANPDLALAVDIWSLGCTIIEMLNGKPPWSEFEGPQAMFKILNKSPPIPETLSSEGKDFLRCCFRREPAERPSAIILLDHPFLRNSHDQNISVTMQTYSTMNITEKSLSPKDHTRPLDHISTSPGIQIMDGFLHCRSPSANVSGNVTISAVNSHPFALSKIHGREVPHLI